MSTPFDDVMDELDSNELSSDGFSDAADDGFSDDSFTDDFSGDAALDMGDGADSEFASDDGFEGDSFDGGGVSAWDAFEDEIADGLDAADTDEFLGRILGGLGRAAGALSRSGAVRRVGQMAGRVAPIARGVGQAAGGASQIAGAAAQLAQRLGSQQWANRLNSAGNIAGQVGRAANQVGNIAGRTQGAAQAIQGAGNNPAQMLTGVLSSLFGQGFDEFEAFDHMIDAYDGEDIDEALPALVGLAARGVARGIGMQNVSQLGQQARRAIVRGVATAARELVGARGPQAARALPAVANAATRAVRRRGASPAQAPQQLRQQLPRTARQVAQTPQALRQAARRRNPRRPGVGRPTNVGRGARSGVAYNPQRIVFNGPVELLIRQLQ